MVCLLYSVAMEENMHAALWTNQMGYITLIAQLPGIYGNVNCPCSRATPSDSGQFTAIDPRQLGNNYYVLCINYYADELYIIILLCNLEHTSSWICLGSSSSVLLKIII